MVNAQKATTDRHEQQIALLKDAGSRLDHLEDQQLELMGLPGRVDALEHLKTEISEIKATILTHDRESKLERRAINDHLKNFETENRIEHDGFNKRIENLENSLSQTLQLESRVQVIETDNLELKKKVKICQEYIAEVERNCKHGKQVSEKRIIELEEFIDKILLETNQQLDSNMQQFEHVIYDIDERLQKLEKQEVKLRKTQNTTTKRFTQIETYLNRKEAEPNVATVSKRVIMRAPVKESSFQQDGSQLIEEEFEESDEDVDIEDADEKVRAGTPAGYSTKSIQSLPVAKMPTDPGSRYSFSMVKFNSPVRYLRKAGNQLEVERSIDTSNYLLPERKSTKPSWSERMFRRSEQFDPEQVLGLNYDKQKGTANQSERQSFIDPLKTPPKSVVVEKNYRVENEDEMKDILRNEIGDLLVSRDQPKAERDGEENELQTTQRSVSPVDYLRPLDQQSELMRSFLQSSQNAPLSNRSFRTPSPKSKLKYRGGNEKHERSYHGTVVNSRKIFDFTEENNMWHQERERKERKHTKKYLENTLARVQDKLGMKPKNKEDPSPTSKIEPAQIFARDFKIQPSVQTVNTPNYSARVVSATSKLSSPRDV